MLNLEEYKDQVEKIRQQARDNGISDVETSKVFENVFHKLEKTDQGRGRSRFFYIKLVALLILATVFCLFNFDHRPFATTIVRNLQTSIYPGLRILRRIAVPVIRHYPHLSEYYDEWCLIENPFFYVSEMDCWPCSMVQSVPDLTGRSISRSFNLGIPYTRSENKTEVHFRNLHELFWSTPEVFEKNAAKIHSNNSTYRDITDLMKSRLDVNPSKELHNHFIWRINRMEPGRILRKLFPKPVNTPEWWEQSIEKYILIDEAKSPSYLLPNPECSNVVVRCTSGARLIKMMPSAECSQSCKSSTILLSAGNTLWYNWWYWRPISLPPSNSTSISIFYLTSFC